MTKKFNLILFFIVLLILGYLFFNRTPLFLLIKRNVVPPEITSYKRQIDDLYFSFWSSNIVEKGFYRFKIQENNNLVISNASLDNSKNIVKFSLPKGFRYGILRFYTNAKSEFSIKISSNQKDWKTFDYPIFFEGSPQLLNLNKNDSANGNVYFKFISSVDQTLQVSFDEFLFVSDLPSDLNDYSNYLLFAPDIDVDYDGNIIKRPGMTYGEYKSK